MGEYATFNGERIKIGTCEDMLYLRWGQRELVTGSDVPLSDPKVLSGIRFRFPWPDEDDLDPGRFENGDRGFPLHGFEQPKEIVHGTAQFINRNGYLVSLPCPESEAAKPLNIGKNGYRGPAHLIQQAWRDGRLVGIAKCNGCGTIYRLDNGYQEAAAVAICSQADRKVRDYEINKMRGVDTSGDLHAARRIREIADRLLAGYYEVAP